MGRADRLENELRLVDDNAEQRVAPMSANKQSSFSGRSGFTLVEVMIASAISMLVMLGLITFFTSTYAYWHDVNLRMEADSDANIAMSRMVYGMGDRLGLRTAKEVVYSEVKTGGKVSEWTLNYVTGGETPQANSFIYSAAGRSLLLKSGAKQQIAGRDIGQAKVTVDAKMLTLQLSVEKKEQGKLKASRQIETKVHFRNTKE